MTILYSGDPRDFIDCGKISMWAAEGHPQVDAGGRGQAEARAHHPQTGRPSGAEAALDARTTVHFSGLPGGSTRVDARTRYVVTKEVHSFAFGGGKNGKDKWLGSKRETIAFATGERASFSAGTTCIATGKLEQAVLAGVCASTAARRSASASCPAAAPGWMLARGTS